MILKRENNDLKKSFKKAISYLKNHDFLNEKQEILDFLEKNVKNKHLKKSFEDELNSIQNYKTKKEVIS